MNRNKLGSAGKTDGHDPTFKYNRSNLFTALDSLERTASIPNNSNSKKSRPEDDNDDFVKETVNYKKRRLLDKTGNKIPSPIPTYASKRIPVISQYTNEPDDDFQTTATKINNKRTSISVQPNRIHRHQKDSYTQSTSGHSLKSSTSSLRPTPSSSASLLSSSTAPKRQSQFCPKVANYYMKSDNNNNNSDDNNESDRSSQKPFSLSKQPQVNHLQQQRVDDLYDMTDAGKDQPSPPRTAKHSEVNQRKPRSHLQQQRQKVDDLYDMTDSDKDQPSRSPSPPSSLVSSSTAKNSPNRRSRLYQKDADLYRNSDNNNNNNSNSNSNSNNNQSSPELFPLFSSTSEKTSELKTPKIQTSGLSATNKDTLVVPGKSLKGMSGGGPRLMVPRKHSTLEASNMDRIISANINSNRSSSGLTSGGTQQGRRSMTNSSTRSTNDGDNQLMPKKHQTSIGTNRKRLLSIKKDRLVLPGKQTMKKMELLASLPSQSTYEPPSSPIGLQEDQVECPYCRAVLDLNQSSTVALAYDEIKYKEKQFQDAQQTANDDLLDSLLQQDQSTSSTHDYSSSTNYRKRRTRRPVSNMEQFSFCQLHNIELVVKPEGNRRNWPSEIIFENILDRILGFKDELDMIIGKKLDSSYRTMALEAYKDLGMHKARSTMGMMTRFETVLPGYYGTKGAAIIQEHLAALYLHQGILNRDIVAPQTAMEYLQQVLIPEVGFRLIRGDLLDGDRNKQHEPDLDDQAKCIMSESAAYGSSLHPVDWNDALSADEDDDDTNDDDDEADADGVILIDDDIQGGQGGKNDTSSGNQHYEPYLDQEKKDRGLETQYILEGVSDDSEDEDDKLFDQTSINAKRPMIYDLCDD